MKAFGQKRTHANCRVFQAGFGKKIKFTLKTKSRKAGRKFSLSSFL